MPGDNQYHIYSWSFRILAVKKKLGHFWEENSVGARKDDDLMMELKNATLPETNIFAPKNGWLEYYFPIGKAYFQGLCQFQGG